MPTKSLGRLARDSNRKELQAGTGISTQDATTVPITSPYTYLGVGNITTINIPTNAAEFIIKPSTDLRISELNTMARSYTVSAGATHAFSVAGMNLIYIDAVAAGGVLNFYFLTV